MVNAMLLKVKSAMMGSKVRVCTEGMVAQSVPRDDGKVLRMNVAADLSQLQFQALA